MRTTSSILRFLAPIALGLLLLAGCKVKEVTFTEGSGSADDAAVEDAPPDVPSGPPGFLVDMPTTTVPEGQTRTFTVALTHAPAEAMLVTIATANDAKLGVSPTALLFSGANWQLPQTVTLTGKSDSDTADEVVALTLVSAAIATPFAVDITVDDDDGLALALSAQMLDVSEGATGSVNVSLTAQPAADVTVTVMSGNLNAAQISLTSLTFTPLNWMIPQALTVTGMQDADTANATTTITFTSPDLTTTTLAVQITDDDVLGISLSASSLSITEGGSDTFTAVLTQQPSADVTIAATSSAAAVAGVSPASLTFTSATWDIAQTVSVNALNDDDVADGSATVTLAATGLTPRAVAITVDDDDAQAIQSTPAAAIAVIEGSTATLNVRLAFRPSQDVTVSASSLAPGIASVAPATLTFSATNYAMNQPVTITALQDANAVAGTTSVRLESAAQGLQRDVTVNITDDDTLGIQPSTATVAVTEGATATFNVRLTAEPQATTTVSLATSDSTAATVTPSLTFTTANWSTDQAVTVTGVQDADLAAETVTLTLSSSGMTNQTVTATVTDNDTQAIVGTPATVAVTEGSTATLGVKLAFQPAADVTVAVASANTAAATVNLASLTFTPANYATAQNVTVTGVQDPDALAATSTINLTATGIGPTAIPVNVTDDDALNIDLTPTTLAITEGAAGGTLSVRLTAQPAAATTVTIATSDAGAASVSTTTLAFSTTDWATYKTVTVAGVEDADAAAETVTITASSTGLTPRTASITVADNDPLNVVTTVSAVAVTEGATGTFGVKLSAQPGGTVTVNIASADTTAATVSPSQLTFDSATWNTNQTVTITGVQDNDVVAESVALTLTATGVGTATVTATLTEDDTQAITIKAGATLSVNEGGTGTISVNLAYQPAGTVTVTVTPGAPVTATPATLTFDAATWNTSQNVTVGGKEDPDAANAMTTVGFTATGVTGATANVTVVDNDTLGISVTTPVTISEGGTGTIAVVLTAQPAASTIVTVTSGDTGAVTAAPTSVTFSTANWNVAQNVTVTGVQDADANAEIVSVSFASTGLTTRTSTVNVTDDEVQSIVTSLTSTSVTETGTRTFTVRLAAQPAGTVAVNVASNLTGKATVSPASLSFTSTTYATTQTVTISGVADADFNFEDVVVTVSSTGLTSRQITVKVVEPDIIAPVVINPSLICPFETAVMPVKLQGDPKGSLTITITYNTAYLFASPTTLTFTSANFGTNQNVYIDGESQITSSTVSAGSTTYPGINSKSDTIGVRSPIALICSTIR